jgi:hypothetical protein
VQSELSWKWRLRKGLLADVLGKIHGLVKDACDFNSVPAYPVKDQVFGDPIDTAAIGEIVSGFAAGEDGVVHDVGSGGGKKLEVGGSLFDSPSFDGVAEDFGKIPFCEF